MEWFRYEDIEGDEIVLEINFNLLNVKAKATIYNFKGEVISRNKLVGWWSANTQAKFFRVLKNNIGNMSIPTREAYLRFIEQLENKYTLI